MSSTSPPEVRPSEVRRAAVLETPVSVEEHAELVAHVAAGAVVTFAGVVRNHDGGRDVAELEYSGHPSAERIIREVAEEVAARVTGVRAAALANHQPVLAC